VLLILIGFFFLYLFFLTQTERIIRYAAELGCNAPGPIKLSFGKVETRYKFFYLFYVLNHISIGTRLQPMIVKQKRLFVNCLVSIYDNN
jgi:hypothetical protein